MRWALRIFSLMLLLVGAGLGIWLYLDNSKAVQMVFFGQVVSDVPLALWLLAFFVAGTILGLSVSALQGFRHRATVWSLRKQLSAQQAKSVI